MRKVPRTLKIIEEKSDKIIAKKIYQNIESKMIYTFYKRTNKLKIDITDPRTSYKLTMNFFWKMKIFPAIDIKDKKCVRLVKGDFDKKTEYEMSPVDQARNTRIMVLKTYTLLI